MAVNQVKATINGTSYTLTYNSSTGAYEATITAPSKSSFNQSGGFYDVSVTAYDDAGNTTTVNSADSKLGDSLKLYVKEKVAPTISFVSPTSGASLTNNKPTITWKCADADSGVKTIRISVDGGSDVSSTSTSESSGTYTCTYVPGTALADGSHTIKVTATDNDGNTATSSITFKIDTAPPILNVTSPTDNLKTNKQTVTVQGTTNDATSSPVSVRINDVATPVGTGGVFTKSVTLTPGENIITIVSTDSAGRSTTVKRTVYYDDVAPTIQSISLVPNPVDAGKTFVISVKVTD